MDLISDDAFDVIGFRGERSDKKLSFNKSLWNTTEEDQDHLAADVPDDWKRDQTDFSSQQLLPFIDQDNKSKRNNTAGLNTHGTFYEVGEEIMKQQLQVSKRPQTPATPSQARYPPREVPPRFMQQQKQQQVKGKKAEVDYSGWGDSNVSEWDQVVVDDRDKEAWPSVGEERSDATWGVLGGEGMGSEYNISASSSSPSPVSGSVITGSSGGPNSWPSLGDSRSCSLITSDTMSGVSGNSCGAQSPNNDWGVSIANCGSGGGGVGGNNASSMDVPGNGSGGDASTRRTDSYRVTQHGHVQSSPISEGNGRQQIPGDVLMEGVTSSSSSSMWGSSSSNSENANGGGPNGSGGNGGGGGWRVSNSQQQQQQQQQPSQGQQQYARTASGISQNGRNIPNNNVPTGSGLHMNDNAASQNYGGAGGAMGMHSAANPNLVVNAQYSSSASSSSNGSSSLVDMQSDNSNGGNGARNETRGGISGWNTPSSRMGLLGGGESSVNTGTSGWGSAGGVGGGSGGGNGNGSSGSGGNGGGGPGWNLPQGTNSAQSQWGATSSGGGSSRNGGSGGPGVGQASPSKPINTWAQAAGKGLNSGGGNSGGGSQGSCVIGQRESQPEVDIRQVITSQDEWGQGGVNQDTAWDLPGASPESPKDKTAMWKATQNNGTEIWENTVRNGGKNTNNVPTPTNTQPWGANPTTNIGGTWGEEEDTTFGNVWTGVPRGGGNGGGGSGSGGNGSGGNGMGGNNMPGNNNNNMGGNNMGGNGIGGGGGGNNMGGNNMGGNAIGGGSRNSSSGDSWGGNGGNGGGGGVGGGRGELVGGGNGGSNGNGGGGGPGNNGGGTNNESGNREKMWNGPAKEVSQWGGGNGGGGANGGSGWGDPNSNNAINNDGDDGTNAWSAPPAKIITQRSSMPPKDLKLSGGGWEEPSPPPVRRGMASVDDGTAVWGSPNTHNKVSRWKESPSGNTKGGAPGPNLSSQSSTPGPGPSGQGSGVIRIPPGTPTGIKSENNIGGVWGKPQHRWTESSHEMNATWDDGMGSSGMRPGNGSSNGNNGGGGGGNGGGGGGNGGGNGSWGEPSSPLANNWDNKSKPASNWSNDMQVNTSNWGQPLKQGAKPLSKDLIWASRQFRLLHEMGFKKEDVENALRNASMNYEEALNELQGGNGNNLQMGDNDVFGGHHSSLRGDDDHSSVLDVNFPNANVNSFGNNMYTNSGIIGGPNQTNAAFKPQAGMNNGNLLHGGAGHNTQLPNLVPGVGNLHPNIVQKLLQQQQLQQQQQQQQQQHHQPQHMQQFQPNLGGVGGVPTRAIPQSVPSTNQLRLIVQQIQMAVQAGHLNPQILNQSLSPQTLLLLNQLLNQIKTLQQLQLTSQPLGKATGSTAMHLSVQITKAKQQITNLQNQIVAQQAAYMKQQVINQHMQQHQQHHQAAAAATPDFMKPPLDPLTLIHGGIQDLGVKDPTPGTPTPTSRLSQWKLPSMEKELDPATTLGGGNSSSGGDFSRAPGTVTKMPTGSSSYSANPGMNSIFGQTDSTWSLTRSHSDSGWPDGSSTGETAINGSGGAADQWSSTNQSNYNLGDLVTEFEPGKPWKGSQLKNIEDDPHITPGSVVRSPLNTIKESELFNSLSKNSQAPVTEITFTTPSLSSATWSFSTGNSPGAVTSSAATGLNYSGSNFGKKWGNETHSSELWSNVSSKPRGPPPGLGAQSKAPAVTSSWGNSGGNSGGGGGGGNGAGSSIGNRSWSGGSTGWERQTVSTWLMLRNLTPQIDGSTLRTLCMQHGPLSAFHLYLSQGIALVRYSSREEATKAQSALNNCVLGNTTIFAEFANEIDIQQFLQQSGNNTNLAWNQQGNGGGNGGGGGGNGGGVGGAGGNGGGGVRSNSAIAPSASSSFSQYGKSDAGGGPSQHWNGTGLNLHSGQLWSLQSPPNAGNLWGNSTLNDPMDHRGTPSSLNSYLPGDLLGGESV